MLRKLDPKEIEKHQKKANMGRRRFSRASKLKITISQKEKYTFTKRMRKREKFWILKRKTPKGKEVNPKVLDPVFISFLNNCDQKVNVSYTMFLDELQA